jgi:nitric oxide reductase subunit B
LSLFRARGPRAGDRSLQPPERNTVEELRKRDLLVSKTWIQAVALVVVFGFFVLGLLAYRTYAGEAPIPARVVDQQGNVLFTHDDILDGQQVFLRNGLMEYGSIFGHGAYLGPDYTADYL